MKIAVILAEGFETIEALTVVDVMRRAEVVCHTFGIDKNQVTTSHGVKVEADKIFSVDEVKGYDILFLPGGLPGSTNLRDNEEVISIVKYFAENGKYIAAICAAPIVLGKADVLNCRNATCYPGFEDQLGCHNHKEELVVKDGKIITGKGPAAAIPFAFEILNLIDSKKAEKITKAMLFK